MPHRDPFLQKQAARLHYERNKDKMKRRAVRFTREARLRDRAFLDEQKNVPCVDCDERYPSYVMQFDHVRGKKLFNIADHLGRYTRRRLMAEIAKCEVVCANCHAKRTYARRIESEDELDDDELTDNPLDIPTLFSLE